MRVAAITAMLSLFDGSWAVSRKPSKIKLIWLVDEVIDGDTLPHMEITFADSSKDEIYLKRDPENNCFYHGSLKGDIESEVEVCTCNLDGSRSDVETFAITSRLVPCRLVSLLLENGVTYSIDPSEGRDRFNGTDSIAAEAFDAGSKWTGGELPHGVVAKIHVRYDESLVQQFGSREQAEKGVKAIIDLSRPWFKKWKRGLVMDVEIKVLTLQYYAGTIPHPGSGPPHALAQLQGKGAMDPNGYPTAWFRANKCLNPHGCDNTIGLGYVPAFCFPGHRDMGLITNVFAGVEEKAMNAVTFAHELGHNLGMEHDFRSGGRGWSNDEGCNKQGIMSYGEHKEGEWSECSRKDQETKFKEMLNKCMVVKFGEKPTAETCKCNSKSVPSGKRYAGAGACDSDWRMSCGSFCFVEKGTCKDEVHLHGLEEYGFASCTPCSQRSNTAPLKEAECPSDTFTSHGNGSPILIGRGFGLIAAGLLMALF